MKTLVKHIFAISFCLALTSCSSGKEQALDKSHRTPSNSIDPVSKKDKPLPKSFKFKQSKRNILGQEKAKR